jgi:hypothetical protein
MFRQCRYIFIYIYCLFKSPLKQELVPCKSCDIRFFPPISPLCSFVLSIRSNVFRRFLVHVLYYRGQYDDLNTLNILQNCMLTSVRIHRFLFIELFQL